MTISNSSRSIIIFLVVCLALSLAGCAKFMPAGIGPAAKSATREAGIVMLLLSSPKYSAPAFPVVLPTQEINLKVYRDANESLASYKTFDFDYTSKTNELLEQDLFRQLEKALQARGLTRVTKNPQIRISMDFFVGKKEQYTPPTTVTSTEIQTVWNTAIWGWDVGGFTSAVPITSSTTKPGYTTTSYYNNIRLNFLNRAKLVKGAKLAKPPMLWLGEIDTEGPDPDIRVIAPVLFSELMSEFPNSSGTDPKRYVRHFRYGGFGLWFDSKDWRVVRYVEPSSVADQNGIKPGDLLLGINGKSAINLLAAYPSNFVLYSFKDPYFMDVLSSRGNSDVEVVIRPAETKKTVTLQMRPRLEDRFVHVNSSGWPYERAIEPSK